MSILTRQRAKTDEEKSPENCKEDEMAKDIAEPTILEQFAADKSNFEDENGGFHKLPKWLYKYLVFRFDLLNIL